MIVRIDSPQDPRIDLFARLTEHQLRNRLESERAVMIAESRLVVELALERGLEPVALLLDERRLASLEPLLLGLDESVPVYVGQRETLTAITGFRVTRGVLCALRRPEPRDPRSVLDGARRVAVLEGLVDATNVGALLRSAAALGVDAALLDPTCADPYSRRAARVSMGCSYTLPWARLAAAEWPDAAFCMLREAGFHTLAMALTDDAVPLDEVSPTAHRRLALAFGTEGRGLSPQALAACDEAVVIPMAGGVDSLNVAASSAVAFWQLCRRRHFGPLP